MDKRIAHRSDRPVEGHVTSGRLAGVGRGLREEEVVGERPAPDGRVAGRVGAALSADL